MLFYFYLLFPSVFFLAALTLGLITPGYNPVKEPISMLAVAPDGIWQTLNFIICGFFIFLLGFQIQRLHSPILIKKLVSNTIALVGIFLILLGFFPTDRSFMPTTLNGVIHLLLFILIVATFLIGELIAGIKMFNNNRFYASYSLLSFALSLVAVILMLAYQGYLGIFQRIFVATIIFWFTLSPLVIKQK